LRTHAPLHRQADYPLLIFATLHAYFGRGLLVAIVADFFWKILDFRKNTFDADNLMIILPVGDIQSFIFAHIAIPWQVPALTPASLPVRNIVLVDPIGQLLLIIPLPRFAVQIPNIISETLAIGRVKVHCPIALELIFLVQLPLGHASLATNHIFVLSHRPSPLPLDPTRDPILKITFLRLEKFRIFFHSLGRGQTSLRPFSD
jgi:hypothetical protein